MQDQDITVLHVIETLSQGGAERLLVTILPELLRQNVNAEVVVLRPPYDLRKDLEVEGIIVHLLPKRHKWSVFLATLDLAKLARSKEADILHAHLYFPMLVTALAKMLRLFSGVTHVSFHNFAYGGANKKTWKLTIRRMIAQFLVFRGIDQPQAVSKACADHYMQAYNLSDVKIIQNALDMRVLQTVSVKAGETIVLPGRLVHEKGHADLIAAVERLGPDCPPVIFAGDGPLRCELEKGIHSKNLPITITGRLDHMKMLETIAGARIIVVPSRYEGFGITALEALALGRPVIYSDVGGLPEVMGDVGKQFPAGSPDALARALRVALSDKEWRSSQETLGRARAAMFAVSTIVKRQIELYEQTLKVKASHE